jgi:hypothetical protein
VDVFLSTNHRLAADGYQNTAGDYKLSENAYRFETDDYRHATARRYENAPDCWQKKPLIARRWTFSSVLTTAWQRMATKLQRVATSFQKMHTDLQLMITNLQRIIFTMMRKMACKRSHSSPDGGRFPRYYQPLGSEWLPKYGGWLRTCQ